MSGEVFSIANPSSYEFVSVQVETNQKPVTSAESLPGLDTAANDSKHEPADPANTTAQFIHHDLSRREKSDVMQVARRHTSLLRAAVTPVILEAQKLKPGDVAELDASMKPTDDGNYEQYSAVMTNYPGLVLQVLLSGGDANLRNNILRPKRQAMRDWNKVVRGVVFGVGMNQESTSLTLRAGFADTDMLAYATPVELWIRENPHPQLPGSPEYLALRAESERIRLAAEKKNGTATLKRAMEDAKAKARENAAANKARGSSESGQATLALGINGLSDGQYEAMKKIVNKADDPKRKGWHYTVSYYDGEGHDGTRGIYYLSAWRV